mgnify:CR=1 FL=1
MVSVAKTHRIRVMRVAANVFRLNKAEANLI